MKQTLNIKMLKVASSVSYILYIGLAKSTVRLTLWPAPSDVYTDHLRRPVFCRCWPTSVELFANRTKTIWQSRTV